MVRKVMHHIKRRFYDSHPELPLDPDAPQSGRHGRPIHLTLPLQMVVFVGGCFGALARYGVMLLVPNVEGSWPLATFIVNLLGAFLLGVLLEALERRGKDEGGRRLLRLGLGTGFLGAFTTYSALAVEVDLLAKDDRLYMAATYAIVTTLAGILLCMLGIWAAGNHHRRKTKRAA